jgi:hypothetical protein
MGAPTIMSVVRDAPPLWYVSRELLNGLAAEEYCSAEIGFSERSTNCMKGRAEGVMRSEGTVCAYFSRWEIAPSNRPYHVVILVLLL